MCGIVLEINKSPESKETELWKSLITLNTQRGPNAQNTTKINVNEYGLRFFVSVLHLRGDHATVQPHELAGNILCWNGEVFEGIEIASNENDGTKLFERLCSSEEPVIDVLGDIEGPYSFIFYESRSRTIYFGRDPLGRRSLLIKKPTAENSVLLLASVSNGDPEFEEVSPETIFSICLDAESNTDSFNIKQIARSDYELQNQFTCPVPLSRDFPPINHEIPVDPLDDIWIKTVNDYLNCLERSVALRTRDIPRHASIDADSARVAVLFSGGIDCAVVAFLAHRQLPLTEPIDLLNVAFENPRTLEGQTQSSSKAKRKKAKEEISEPTEASKYLVPDRLTGLSQVEEFRRLAPERTWNFVEINIPYEHSTAHRPIIEQLMAPSRTLMDLSLAQALYFASRGVGVINFAGEYRPYTSKAPVILSGLGADELLGGYTRHKNAFKHRSWEGLLNEMQLDVDRIHTRNLGRDDRVISSHGKEARYPFLSMSLVAYLSSLPVYLKADPRISLQNLSNDRPPSRDEGLQINGLPGDKLLHRLAARRLGLLEASIRAKRAMQFGSRSARMQGGEGTKGIKADAVLI